MGVNSRGVSSRGVMVQGRGMWAASLRCWFDAEVFGGPRVLGKNVGVEATPVIVYVGG